MPHYRQLIYWMPLFGFLVCLLSFWPGLVRPDSIVQLQGSLNGVPSDWHPPMLGFVWSLFFKFYTGPGPMFALHLALYWGAVAIYMGAATQHAKWFFVIALFPPVITYQLLVIKDIGFVNAYLFGCAWLYFYSLRELRPSLLSLLGWCLIVLYGTGCAYQSVAVLPWLCLWLGRIYWSFSLQQWIYKSLLIFLGFGVGVGIFNSTMSVPSYSAQQLQLYDLAGISKQLDQEIFPKYITNGPRYDFERIKALYNCSRVEDLTFIEDTPLILAINQQQRDELKATWMKAIISHPAAYLKHRTDIFSQQMTVSLLKKPGEIKGEVTQVVLKLLAWLSNSWIFQLSQWMMAYIGYFFVQILLIYKGFRHFKDHPKYAAMFFQNIASMTLIAALFFVARAAEARYAYLAVVMCCFSLPLLYHSHFKPWVR